jgi:hypothetical protein
VKTVVLILALAVSMSAQAVPDAPKVQSDGSTFHRTNDFAYGAVVSGVVGSTTRPWIGLVTGEAAGIANEARYGRNFNVGHLAVISAGAVASYGLIKLIKHYEKH